MWIRLTRKLADDFDALMFRIDTKAMYSIFRAQTQTSSLQEQWTEHDVAPSTFEGIRKMPRPIAVLRP